VAERLPNIQRRIFELVYLDQRSHRECYEMLRSADMPGLTFREFRAELRATYQAVVNGRRGQIVPELSGFAVPLEEEVAGEIDPGPEPARQAVLEQALGLLDAEDRVAVELYVMGGVPADQVAAMLGLPNAKAVYNRVYRALAAVRERLETAGIRREDL
jgi:DNA-directed RNA polymerase specialized sigma24 family protein